MHYLSAVYFAYQPLNVSGIFVAHHREVYCIYTTFGTYSCIYTVYPWWWATNMPETCRG